MTRLTESIAMTSKKYLLVYEAFDKTNEFLLKGNVAIELDAEKVLRKC